MAFGMTISDRISFGNMKLRIYNVTDAQSAGSDFFPGCDTCLAVKAINNTDSSDTFKEKVGGDDSPDTRNKITLTPVSDDDDGQAWIWMR
jgi:hypothetical protein